MLRYCLRAGAFQMLRYCLRAGAFQMLRYGPRAGAFQIAFTAALVGNIKTHERPDSQPDSESTATSTWRMDAPASVLYIDFGQRHCQPWGGNSRRPHAIQTKIIQRAPIFGRRTLRFSCGRSEPTYLHLNDPYNQRTPLFTCKRSGYLIT